MLSAHAWLCTLQLAQLFPVSLPHVACAVLRGSALFPVLAELLKLDSLEEICARRTLYLAAMSVLQSLGAP